MEDADDSGPEVCFAVGEETLPAGDNGVEAAIAVRRGVKNKCRG